MLYLVKLEFEIEAETPQEAATTMRDMLSFDDISRIDFEVVDKDGVVTTVKTFSHIQ